MALKREPEKHANHERWLVSYGDLLTLLFAVFVVMYAMGQTDKKKSRRGSCINAGFFWLFSAGGSRSAGCAVLARYQADTGSKTEHGYYPKKRS